MEYIGFVPGVLVSSIKHIRIRMRVGTGGEEDIFEREKQDQRRYLYSILRADVNSSCLEARRHAYIIALALCITDGLTPQELLYSFGVAREQLAWTFLKQEDSGGIITAVSPLANDVIQQYLSTDVVTQEQTVKSRELSIYRN